MSASAPQTNNPGVGGRIRRYRRERGWTQAQLGRATGLSAKTISSIERGRERPLERSARALAEALGVELDRLLGLAGQPMLFPLPDQRRMDIIRRVALLDDDQIEEAQPFLEGALEMVEQARRPKKAKAPARDESDTGA